MIKRLLAALWKLQYKLPIHLHKEYWIANRHGGWMNHAGMKEYYKEYTMVSYMIVIKKKGRVD